MGHKSMCVCDDCVGYMGSEGQVQEGVQATHLLLRLQCQVLIPQQCIPVHKYHVKCLL